MIGWRLSLLAAVLALCAGLWGGDAWRKGRTAIEQNAQLKAAQAADRKAIAELKQAAQDLRQHGVDATLAYDQAAQRMDAIATQLEQDRDANRRYFDEQAQARAALSEARPDLRDLRLGDDVLRHWNRGNQGRSAEPATPAATPGRAGKPAPAVPAAPAARGRQGAVFHREPRSDGGAVPRLQRQGRLVGALDRRMARDRVALVLPGGGGLRPAGYRLPC
jgi:hypothetical protein